MAETEQKIDNFPVEQAQVNKEPVAAEKPQLREQDADFNRFMGKVMNGKLAEDGKLEMAATATQANKSDDEHTNKTQNSQPVLSEKRAMSPGEKKFNTFVYRDIGYTTNLISSIAVADYFTNPASEGRKSLDKWISRTTQALTKMGVGLKNAHHNSKVGLETLTLLTGGTLLLIPMKLMEDNKRNLVHKINKKLGHTEVDENGKELGPDEIYIEKEQPKQSWTNVIIRRIIGTFAVVGAGLAVDHIAKDKNTILPQEKYDLGFAKVTYDSKVLGGKERITNKVFGAINKTVEGVSGKKFNPNGVVGRWTNLAILDSVFTVITAVVMWATNGSKKGKMPHEKDKTNHPIIVMDGEDNLVTADEINQSQKNFSDKVERRVENLVASKKKDQQSSFVENIKTPDPSVAGVGIGV